MWVCDTQVRVAAAILLSVLNWLPSAQHNMMDPTDLDSAKYCKTLARIFQTVVSDNRKLSPLVQDFIEKSQKLELQLKSTILFFSTFNDSLSKIAEKGIQQKKGNEIYI